MSDQECTVCKATGSPHGVPKPASDAEPKLAIALEALWQIDHDGDRDARATAQKALDAIADVDL